MSSKKSTLKSVGLVAGTAFAATLAASNVSAASMSDNPFAMSELKSGYQLADAKEGKCGEAKCGANKIKTKEQEGKCGDAKKATKEGQCGEGKKKAVKEGQCGEGKKKVEKEGQCGGKK